MSRGALLSLWGLCAALLLAGSVCAGAAIGATWWQTAIAIFLASIFLGTAYIGLVLWLYYKNRDRM